MKVMLNCCPRPALFSHKDGVTLFKGEPQGVDIKAQPQLKPQLTQDTVELRGQKPVTEEVKEVKKAECVNC